MAGRSTALKVGGIAAGASVALAGLGYGIGRAAVARDRRRPDPDAGDPFLPPYDEAIDVATHDGRRLHAIVRGRGQPVVLLHGMSLSVRTWVKQLEALPEDGFRVVAFDHRGHGGSEGGEDGLTLEDLAEDVRAVLERLDLRDAVLVGHSLGGVVVQAFAVRFPQVAEQRVSGLVLLSTVARTQISGAPGLQRIVAGMFDRAPDPAGIVRHRNLGFLLARVGFGREPRASHVELAREMIAECRGAVTRGATRALLGVDLTGDLPRVAIPVRVVCGSADVLSPPAESRRLARLLPDARLVVLDGGGHMLMLERAEELDRLVAAFAREVSRVRTASGEGAP